MALPCTVFRNTKNSSFFFFRIKTSCIIFTRFFNRSVSESSGLSHTVVPDNVIWGIVQCHIIQSRTGDSAPGLALEDQVHVWLLSSGDTHLEKKSCHSGAWISELYSFFNWGVLLKNWELLVQFLFLKKVLDKTLTASIDESMFLSSFSPHL